MPGRNLVKMASIDQDEIVFQYTSLCAGILIIIMHRTKENEIVQKVIIIHRDAADCKGEFGPSRPQVLVIEIADHSHLRPNIHIILSKYFRNKSMICKTVQHLQNHH